MGSQQISKQKQQDLSMLLLKQELVAEQFIENAKIQTNKDKKQNGGNSKSVRLDKNINMKEEPVQAMFVNSGNYLLQANNSKLINTGNN